MKNTRVKQRTIWALDRQPRKLDEANNAFAKINDIAGNTFTLSEKLKYQRYRNLIVSVLQLLHIFNYDAEWNSCLAKGLLIVAKKKVSRVLNTNHRKFCYFISKVARQGPQWNHVALVCSFFVNFLPSCCFSLLIFLPVGPFVENNEQILMMMILTLSMLLFASNFLFFVDFCGVGR